VHVAVKRLNDVQLAGEQVAEFRKDAEASTRREIAVLGSFRHPNIIRLLGYSIPAGQRLQDVLQLCLVYELADEGGLDAYLQDDTKASRLTYRHRVRMARKIVSALAYLHTHDPQQPAYHRCGGGVGHGSSVERCILVCVCVCECVCAVCVCV
jgi:serine/threonine protein kinase